MYVCICLAVTEADARRTVADGAETVAEVAARCGAGTGCGSCVEKIRALVASRDAEAALTRSG